MLVRIRNFFKRSSLFGAFCCCCQYEIRILHKAVGIKIFLIRRRSRFVFFRVISKGCLLASTVGESLFLVWNIGSLFKALKIGRLA